MNRKQKLGLAVVFGWCAVVVLVTVVTHRPIVLTFIGLAAVFGLPFRAR